MIPRKPNGQFDPPPKYEPSEAQIAAECLEIQKLWTPYETARRQGKRIMPQLLSGSRVKEVTHRLWITEPEPALLFDPQ